MCFGTPGTFSEGLFKFDIYSSHISFVIPYTMFYKIHICDAIKSLVTLLIYQRECWLAHTYSKGTKRTLIYFQQYSWFIVFPTIG